VYRSSMPKLASSSRAFAFPEGFLWGASTSAYQVEGSPLADGAGPSIWHRFSHTPGRTAGDESGDTACDHYRRWREDVALMRELDLNAYRFSVSWSRVLPDGIGRINRRGLAFYDRLVDALLEAGIRPMATLYHWDLPAALDDRGGWLNRDIAGWFAEYARTVVRALDDRVALWATLNEPWVVMDAGYLHGVHAPGHRSLFEAPIAAHNLLRAHGAAVRAYRAEGRHSIGLVVNLEPKVPASRRSADVAAANRSEAYWNRFFLDPVCLGRYPDEVVAMFGEAWPGIRSADLAEIRQPLDFIGVNYYSRGVVRHQDGALPDRAAKVRVPRATYTEMPWEVHPRGLTDILLWVTDRYAKLPIYVTENGAAFYDPPTVAERVEDPLRAAYLREHLLALGRAIEAGVDVRGYFVWSLLDNYEWSLGTSKRFGIVHVDFATQRRTVKESGRFYSRVIRSGGAALVGGGGE
jgi:beta-glucosidase